MGTKLQSILGWCILDIYFFFHPRVMPTRSIGKAAAHGPTILHWSLVPFPAPGLDGAFHSLQADRGIQ